MCSGRLSPKAGQAKLVLLVRVWQSECFSESDERLLGAILKVSEAIEVNILEEEVKSLEMARVGEEMRLTLIDLSRSRR